MRIHLYQIKEIANFAFSGKLIALETGMRFLTDLLLGDIYFKIAHTNQNLDRARCQVQLAKQLKKCEAHMQKSVERLINMGKAVEAS